MKLEEIVRFMTNYSYLNKTVDLLRFLNFLTEKEGKDYYPVVEEYLKQEDVGIRFNTNPEGHINFEIYCTSSLDILYTSPYSFLSIENSTKLYAIEKAFEIIGEWREGDKNEKQRKKLEQ